MIDKNRKLWLDTRGVPVITTTKNGEANAIRWGWTEAKAVAATRVPVQGEPNDDREALKRIAEVASEQRLKDSIAEYKDATLDEMEPTDWELEFWHAGYKSGALSIIEHNLSRATVPDAALAEAKKQLGEIQRHFTAIAGSGEIRVYEDTGEKHGIDYQSSVWAKRGERMTRDLIEFLGEHHRPEPVGNGESK